MVKKAEQVKKRNPMLPVSFTTAIALWLSPGLFPYYVVIVPQIKNTMTGTMLLPTGQGTLILPLNLAGKVGSFNTFFRYPCWSARDPIARRT